MRVSYIVTVYNKERYLDAVLGHLDGEYSETGGEIIIVNDGSTDNSLKIIKDFAATRDYVIVNDQKNCGVASATNVGFSLSSCPLVRFVDGDDLLVPGSTKRLAVALEEHGVGFAYGQYGNYASGDIVMPEADQFASARIEDPLWQMIRMQLFIPSAALAVREVIAGCFPLPEKYRTSQDYIMGIRFAQKTAFAEVKGSCCLAPKEAPGRLSASQARMYFDTAHILADEISVNPTWPKRHLRFVIRRTAGRALNYARRNTVCGRRQIVWLTFIKMIMSLPFVAFSEKTLIRIADTYVEALKAPDKFP